MTEKCNYPDCCCPIDKGADDECLLGLKENNEAATVTEADAVGLSATNDVLCDYGASCGNAKAAHVFETSAGKETFVCEQHANIALTCMTHLRKLDT